MHFTIYGVVPLGSSTLTLMVACFIFEMYAYNLLVLLNCLSLGATLNEDKVINDVCISVHPMDMTHCKDPTND